MVVIVKALFNLSIWAKHSIPAGEWKYRNLKRVLFPIVYLLFFCSGFYADQYGVPAISDFFPYSVIHVFSYILGTSSVLCLLGIAFPRLWPLEILGGSVILGLMTGYLLSLFIIAVIGPGNRGFVLFVSAIALAVVVWRLSLIGAEWQARRLDIKGE